MNSVFSATIEGVATRRDQTLKVTLGTQELDPQSEVELMQLRKSGLVKVLISSDEITEQQKEAVSSVELEAPKGKSPSQRLRAVIYRVWEQRQIRDPFNEYYADKMEAMIIHFKNKLDD